MFCWAARDPVPVNPLKILQIITPALDPHAGGVQMTTWKLASYFVRQGHDSAIFSFASANHAEKPPGQLYRAGCDGGSASSANRRELSRILVDYGPDVVINHMPYEHRITNVLHESRRGYLLVACLRNTLYSVRLNLNSYIERTIPRAAVALARTPAGQRLLLQWHQIRHARDLRRILNSYDYFVMFGPPNLEELAHFVPDYKRQKIALIPNSVPTVADALPVKEKRILWLGRMDQTQKRAELLPELWSLVHERLPDWEFHVVGTGPLLEPLKTETQARRLPRMLFHGRQPPEAFFRSSAIFVMTSAFEGFPNTLIEAQSQAAVPIIFDSYPVASWLVEDGSNGYLIPAFDLVAMAERIVAVAQDPQRSRIAAECLESAHQFHIDRVGAMWEGFLRQALADRSGKASSGSGFQS